MARVGGVGTQNVPAPMPSLDLIRAHGGVRALGVSRAHTPDLRRQPLLMAPRDFIGYLGRWGNVKVRGLTGEVDEDHGMCAGEHWPINPCLPRRSWLAPRDHMHDAPVYVQPARCADDLDPMTTRGGLRRSPEPCSIVNLLGVEVVKLHTADTKSASQYLRGWSCLTAIRAQASVANAR